MSNEKTEASGLGEIPAIGDDEKALIEHFVLDYAREISTDGGRTAKINGAIIVLDQPTARPKTRK